MLSPVLLKSQEEKEIDSISDTPFDYSLNQQSYSESEVKEDDNETEATKPRESKNAHESVKKKRKKREKFEKQASYSYPYSDDDTDLEEVERLIRLKNIPPKVATATNEEIQERSANLEFTRSLLDDVRDHIMKQALEIAPAPDGSGDERAEFQVEENPQLVQQAGDYIYVVPDTDIFMNSYATVWDIINLEVRDSQKLSIYVPWMVLRELDHCKNSSRPATKATAENVIKCLNSFLAQRNSRVIAQKLREAMRQENFGNRSDEQMLACCFQAMSKCDTVVLLSDNVNLRNKALVNGIDAYGPENIMSKLSQMMSKLYAIQGKLAALWSKIIFDCCKHDCSKTVMAQTPTWFLIECIKRFKIYWSCVFRKFLVKQCKQTIDDIDDFLVKHKDEIVDDSEEFNSFMKLVVQFMVFLQYLPDHKDSVRKSLEEINQIAHSSH